MPTYCSSAQEFRITIAQSPSQEGSKIMFTIQHVYSPYRMWLLWLASGERDGTSDYRSRDCTQPMTVALSIQKTHLRPPLANQKRGRKPAKSCRRNIMCMLPNQQLPPNDPESPLLWPPYFLLDTAVTADQQANRNRSRCCGERQWFWWVEHLLIRAIISTE